MINKYNKIKLLNEICDYYNYKLTFNGDKKIIADSGMKDFYFEYKTLDDALLNWVDTLIDTDDMLLSCGESVEWGNKINFICNNCK